MSKRKRKYILQFTDAELEEFANLAKDKVKNLGAYIDSEYFENSIVLVFDGGILTVADFTLIAGGWEPSDNTAVEGEDRLRRLWIKFVYDHQSSDETKAEYKQAYHTYLDRSVFNLST